MGGQTVVNPDEWSQEYADGAWAQEFQSQVGLLDLKSDSARLDTCTDWICMYVKSGVCVVLLQEQRRVREQQQQQRVQQQQQRVQQQNNRA